MGLSFTYEHEEGAQDWTLCAFKGSTLWARVTPDFNDHDQLFALILAHDVRSDFCKDFTDYGKFPHAIDQARNWLRARFEQVTGEAALPPMTITPRKLSGAAVKRQQPATRNYLDAFIGDSGHVFSSIPKAKQPSEYGYLDDMAGA